MVEADVRFTASAHVCTTVIPVIFRFHGHSFIHFILFYGFYCFRLSMSSLYNGALDIDLMIEDIQNTMLTYLDLALMESTLAYI